MYTEISKINFYFWLNKNPYYDEKPLNSSMIAQQTLMKNKGLNYNFKTCGEVIDQIKFAINNYWETFNHELAIKAFDLIQLWGGKTGRQPYCRGGIRFDLDKWLPIYLTFIDLIKVDDIENSLKNLLKIHGIGTSFATKHLRFWGNKPILDTRIRALLYLGKEIEYSKYLLDLDKLSQQFDLSVMDIEKALFAFSMNYYTNENLILKTEKKVEFKEDRLLAIKLSENFGRHLEQIKIRGPK